ncbi:MAG: ferritin-like domain-containing protein [Leptospiraceae bacterium]|nr:ferritin-like domain-containing protein [Leptospiraceae bacterium]
MLQISPGQARKILKTRPFYTNLGAPSPWSAYLMHFEKNAGPDATWGPSRQSLSTGNCLPLNEEQKKHLLRSLAIFQLGETGEGRVVREITRSRLRPVDAAYRQSLALFVQEEGKHAQMLGSMIRSMGGSALAQNVTHGLFFLARRLMGLRLKIMVLLGAEIIGCECYGMLGRFLKDHSVGDGLLRIQKDERAHLGFHCHFFHLLGRNPMGRWLYLALYFPVSMAACLAVLLDQRKTFRSLGVSTTTMIFSFGRRIAAGARLILKGCPSPEAVL